METDNKNIPNYTFGMKKIEGNSSRPRLTSEWRVELEAEMIVEISDDLVEKRLKELKDGTV